MRSSNVRNMVVTVDREETLNTLIENRERHIKIVKEARAGYMKEARAALAKRLNQLEDGKLVNLSFSLTPPQDYTKVYDVAIKMLEIHTEPTLELDGAQVQHMIMDEWDWMEHFVGSNRQYSATAVEFAASKGW